MKIYNSAAIRAWDEATIRHEPIASVELMNRAALAFTGKFREWFPDTDIFVRVLCGPGNNGGDGLAVARCLHQSAYNVEVWLPDANEPTSHDFKAQYEALPKHGGISEFRLSNADFGFANTDKGITADAPSRALHHPNQETESSPNRHSTIATRQSPTVVIDALFGTGLSRPLEGQWAALVEAVNGWDVPVVAVDIPSGLPADGVAFGPLVHATHTITFERPKLAFFFPENDPYLGEWAVVPIGLWPAFEQAADSDFHMTDMAWARQAYRPRRRFAHKGNFGHALLIAGAFGKMGAAVLAARGALRAGAGLVSVHAPRCGNVVLQTAVPEAMYSADARARTWTSLPEPLAYDAIGVGPGIGKAPETAPALEKLLKNVQQPLVIDADALNLLAENPHWWPLVPENSILTPHPKEFERLFGPSADGRRRLDLLMAKAVERRVVIVLKGAYSAVALPGGRVWFNSTGNPGMATGGSGDVLTGVLTALLAQGYAPEDAARFGVFMHGLSGDLAALTYGQEALIAGDLCDAMSRAWQELA